MFSSLHGVFLTFEPNFVKHRSSAVIDFYEKNILSYILSPDAVLNFQLTIVDTASSLDFRNWLVNFCEIHDLDLYLIDCPISSSDAFNEFVSQKKDDSALYIWLASDTRARDKCWLEILLSDIKIANCDIIYPSCTFDGSANTPQTQMGPVDLDPILIEYPFFCHTICVAFTGKLLEKFDWQLPNRFKQNGNCKSVSLMALAAENFAAISFRCNLIHDQNMPGRHQWTNDSQRVGRVDEYIELAITESGLTPFGFNPLSFEDLRMRSIGKGMNPLTLLLVHLKNLRHVFFKKEGRKKLLRYFANRMICKQNLDSFKSLPFEKRKQILKKMFWS